MGMVMYLRSATADELDGLIGADDELFAWLTDDAAWEADKMWSPALDLLFGRGGVEKLGGEPVTEEAGYTPVMRMSPSATAELAATIASVDEAVVAARFDANSFDEEMGPTVLPEDREWLVPAALRLADLLGTAAHESRISSYRVPRRLPCWTRSPRSTKRLSTCEYRIGMLIP